MPFPVTLRRCVCLLLAALLLAPGTLPLGLAHAHPGADRPHHHHAEDGFVDADHHDDHDDHEDHQWGEDLGPALESASTSHVHFSWLGFDLTLPGPPGGGEPDDPGTTATTPALIGTLDAPTGGTMGPLSWLAPWLLATHPFAWSGPPPAPCRPRLRPPSNPSPPLCDSARHERSGVQLS
jgi:hypothetical protein